MLDYLTSENWPDFRKRYQNTYGWLVHHGKEIPVYITSVNENQVMFQDMLGNDMFATSDKQIPFKFLPLRRRITVGTDGAFYSIARRPATQYKRGVCDDNTILRRLTAAGPMDVNVDRTNVRNILKEGTPKEGVKLNDQFCLVGEIPYLYDMPIGQVIGQSIVVAGRFANFRQELSDVIRDKKLNYKVG